MSNDMFKNILIVEDDLDFRNPMRDFLSARGYGVSVADDGEQAIDRLLTHKPSVVLLDLLLPKIHGFEVLKKIRQYPDLVIAKTPVIILSNLASDTDIKQGEALGISAYFVKSHTDKDQVLGKIKEILFGSAHAKTDHEVWDFTQ
jgi:CheY-like chemotaxis protein